MMRLDGWWWFRLTCHRSKMSTWPKSGRYWKELQLEQHCPRAPWPFAHAVGRHHMNLMVHAARCWVGFSIRVPAYIWLNTGTSLHTTSKSGIIMSQNCDVTTWHSYHFETLTTAGVRQTVFEQKPHLKSKTDWYWWAHWWVSKYLLIDISSSY